MKHSGTIKDLNSFTKKFNFFLKKKLQIESRLLGQAVKYSLFSGGKRFRPYLVYLFSKEYSLPIATAMNLASAIEMFHNYSLVHDDLPSMDNDKYRRGKKTTHYKYNEYTAILAGCGLLTMAYNVLSNNSFKISEKNKIRLILSLTEISGQKGLLQGQFDDLSIKNKSTKQRIEINKLKTGKLMSFCCDAVGIMANKKDQTRKILKKIGMQIGEIFQINDDFEDYPNMKNRDKIALLNYKNQLYKAIQSDLKKLSIKSKKIFMLLDFLMDLKV